jgi:hypothetical protein
MRGRTLKKIWLLWVTMSYYRLLWVTGNVNVVGGSKALNGLDRGEGTAAPPAHERAAG